VRLLADENVDARVVDFLRAAGHDVAEIRTAHRGGDDRAVLEFANRTRRILLTRDKDFGDLSCDTASAAPASC
jgi:predicted nuclease of predicted toxin-antitoxin system